MLLSYNLAEINIIFKGDVVINFISFETKEIYWNSTVTNQELIDEIEYNYNKLCVTLKEINPQILNADLLIEIETRYKEFKEYCK